MLLTTPGKISQRIDYVAHAVGISNKVKELLIGRLESEMAMWGSNFGVSNFVRDIKVNSTLIIHDKNDRVVPISQSRNVARNWKNFD